MTKKQARLAIASETADLLVKETPVLIPPDMRLTDRQRLIALFKQYKFPQKFIARIMGVSEGRISQEMVIIRAHATSQQKKQLDEEDDQKEAEAGTTSGSD